MGSPHGRNTAFKGYKKNIFVNTIIYNLSF